MKTTYNRLYHAAKYIDLLSISNGNILTFESIDRIYKLNNTIKGYLSNQEVHLVTMSYDFIDFTMNDLLGEEYNSFDYNKEVQTLIKHYRKLQHDKYNKDKNALLLKRSIRSILSLLSESLPNEIDIDGKLHCSREVHGTKYLWLYQLRGGYRKQYKVKDIHYKDKTLWYDRLKKEASDKLVDEERELLMEERRVKLNKDKLEIVLLELEINNTKKGKRK